MMAYQERVSKEGIVALGDGVISLATLGVTFGGFSPTLMDGVEKSKEQVEKFEEIAAQRKETLRKQREMEFARTSKEKTYTDESGNEWKYVVVDNAVARIVKMEGTPKSVTIPSVIEGYQVYAIGSEALSENNALEEIICPDAVSSIGACAFRFNPNLRRVVLPANVAEFQSGWIRHCPKLEELVLPGLLDEIKLDVLDNKSLRKLWIGKNVYVIEPGAFQNTALEEIVVDPENPFISNDGAGLYSKDYSVLYALALPVERYAVQDGCRRLAKKSCYGLEALKHVELPSSVVELDPYALSHSGLESFEAPSSLVSIGEKAFYYCRGLKRVTLNEGLEVIGNSAFEESGLDALFIPATIKTIGNSITARTNVVHSGPDCSLEIDPACEKMFLDGEGGLYPLSMYARHLTMLLCGEDTYEGYTAEQVLTGLIFFYDDWKQTPLTIRNGQGHMLIVELHSGQTLRLFPHHTGKDVIWYAPTDSLPGSMDMEHQKYIHDVFSHLNNEVQAGRWQNVDLFIDKMIQYQCTFSSEPPHPYSIPKGGISIAATLLLCIGVALSILISRKRRSLSRGSR